MGYVAGYACGAVIVASILLAALNFVDAKVFRTAGDGQGVRRSKCSLIGCAIHKLLGKVVAMSAVMAVYAYIYLGLVRIVQGGKASLYGEISIPTACAFLVMSLCTAVLGG